MHPWIAGIIVVAMLFPHLVWIDQASGVAWPTLVAGAQRDGDRPRIFIPGCACSASCWSAMPGCLILVAVASNLTRVRNAPAAHRRAAASRSVRARRFVYFFAIVPPLVVTSVAVIISQATPVADLAADRAVGARRRDGGRRPHPHPSSEHHRLRSGRRSLLLPPAIAAFAILLVPWTGIDLRINQPSTAMTQFLSESFERRTGTPLKVVGGDTRLASLLALLSPSRPVIFVDDKPDRPVTRKDIDEKGAVIVWPAADNAGTPPPDIKARFPDLVAEVPRAFERPVQGRCRCSASAGG